MYMCVCVCVCVCECVYVYVCVCSYRLFRYSPNFTLTFSLSNNPSLSQHYSAGEGDDVSEAFDAREDSYSSGSDESWVDFDDDSDDGFISSEDDAPAPVKKEQAPARGDGDSYNSNNTSSSSSNFLAPGSRSSSSSSLQTTLPWSSSFTQHQPAGEASMDTEQAQNNGER